MTILMRFLLYLRVVSNSVLQVLDEQETWDTSFHAKVMKVRGSVEWFYFFAQRVKHVS